MNELEIKAFQILNNDYLGKPLEVDGKLGPKTRWAIAIESSSSYRKSIISRCHRLINLDIVEARNDNRHPVIDCLLQLCSVGLGSAWCAAAASFAVGQPREAGAMRLLNAFPRTLEPQQGDLGGYPTQGWRGHVFVVAGASDTHVMAYEGNQRNAYRVLVRPKKGLIFSQTDPNIRGSIAQVPKDIPVIRNSSSTVGTR